MAFACAAGVMVRGRYRLIALLGKGGMGQVWSADDDDAARSVALKFIRADQADDPRARARLLGEAKAASSVRHPNLVPIYDLFELDDGAPVLVMELMSGESLAARLARSERLELAETASLLLPVISAVGTAHASGIVHRDVKPENIFLARSGEVVVPRILDFGIAKLVKLDADTMDSTGLSTEAVIGTPSYMSPEQVFGEGDIDHRSDIWALGIVLYQCLTGVLLTRGENIGQIFKNVLARPFAPLKEVRPELPGELSKLVERMLSRDRDGRPVDLREVREIIGRHTEVAVPEFAPARKTARVTDGAAVHALVATTAPRPVRRWPWLAAIGGAVILAGTAYVRFRAPPPVAGSSPLAPSSSVLGCPIFAASGVEAPVGWLGAAAAATACERARLLLGGRADRTLVPAELLDLPRPPTGEIPADVYGAAGARERSLSAARRRAAAYLDGEVARQSDGFQVSLTLRRADGAVLGQGTGHGHALYQAIRDALVPLIGPERLPRARALDPVVAEWSRARTVDDALALLDVTLAMAQNGGDVGEECSALAHHSVGEMAAIERWRCAYTLGLATPPGGPPREEEGAAAVAVRARAAHMIARTDGETVIAQVRALLDREPTALGRSVLATTESCLVQSSDAHRAEALAVQAVQADPKNPLGEFCAPWGQLVVMTRDTPSAEPTVRAMQAWTPWDSSAWYMQTQSAGDEATALAYAKRAYVLTPFDANVADVLADKLLANGAREEVRGIAFSLSATRYPVHRLESDLLLVRLDASEARFGAALARARKATAFDADDSGWIRVQRLEVAWRALEVAIILGREREVADAIVERFIDPDPSPLDGAYLTVPNRIPAICARASEATSRRCFARFRQLRASLSGGILRDTDGFTDGAERYARGDWRGAAKAWRPLLRESGVFAWLLPDAMATVFVHTGDVELVERLEAAAATRAGEFNGASPMVAEAARRAAARGDHERAGALARRVIDAWSVADEPVPVLDEMRRLLSARRTKDAGAATKPH